MCRTQCTKCPSAKAPFEKTTIERRELQANDILIDIQFCGICHSDIHNAFDEWGGGIFPMVPGHEMAGVVQVERRPRQKGCYCGYGRSQEMLDFSAEHGIAPKIEIISADQVDEAFERVVRSDVRYRFVIDMSTL